MINEYTEAILDQITDLLERLESSLYLRESPYIQHASIGMHVRHIIEFYQELLEGYSSGIVDYDQRQREKELETDREQAIKRVSFLKKQLRQLKEDRYLGVRVTMSSEENESRIVSSSLYRELAFNAEHAIHHLAIIRIGISMENPDFIIPENLGFAPGTIRHLNSR